jgi:hypothetical protein
MENISFSEAQVKYEDDIERNGSKADASAGNDRSQFTDNTNTDFVTILKSKGPPVGKSSTGGKTRRSAGRAISEHGLMSSAQSRSPVSMISGAS